MTTVPTKPSSAVAQRYVDYEAGLKAKAALSERHKQIWAALNQFIGRHGGWLISTPGDKDLRVEMPVHSELFDRLFDAGFDLQPAGTRERISAGGKILPVNVFTFRIPVK